MLRRIWLHLLVAASLFYGCSLLGQGQGAQTAKVLSRVQVTRERLCSLAFLVPLQELEPLRQACALAATSDELGRTFDSCSQTLDESIRR